MMCAHLLRLDQLIGFATSFGPSQSMMLAATSSPSQGSAASREFPGDSLSMVLGLCDDIICELMNKLSNKMRELREFRGLLLKMEARMRVALFVMSSTVDPC